MRVDRDPKKDYTFCNANLAANIEPRLGASRAGGVLRKEDIMHVIVQAKNFDVTPALSEFTESHAQKLMRRGRNVIKVTVYLETVERKKNDFTAAKITVKVELPGKDVVLEHQSFDIYSGILEALDRAERVMRKAKERHQGRQQAWLWRKIKTRFS